jgi:F-type H+-transporting ATPase subunit delta
VFLKLAQQELGILFVKVTSAFYLTPKQKSEINASVKKYFHNKKVYIHNIVDSSILGGLKIESGSMSIDGSLKNKLKLMKEETYKSIHSGEIMEESYGI